MARRRGGRARKTRKPRAGGLFRARRKGAFVRAAIGIKFFPVVPSTTGRGRKRTEILPDEKRLFRQKAAHAASGKMRQRRHILQG